MNSSPTVTPDSRLADRFAPVILAGLGAAEAESPDGLPAELVLQWCVADGILEVLQWSRQGIGADAEACIWLGALRWHRLVGQPLPEEAPAPPPRELDAALGLTRLALQEASADPSVRGLASGRMSSPREPAQPADRYAPALLRAVAVGLVPYVEEETVTQWARSAIGLTHGHPELLSAAERLALLVHRTASAPAEGRAGFTAGDDAAPAEQVELGEQAELVELGELKEILDTVHPDGPTRAVLTAQLRACSGRPAGVTPADPALGGPTARALQTGLLGPWAEVTAPIG